MFLRGALLNGAFLAMKVQDDAASTIC